jgi:hypothetical protein
LRDTGDIKYLGENLCGILGVILCGREFALTRVTSGYSNSLANCGNEVVGKLRKIPGGKPWKSIGGKPWKHLVKGTEKNGGTSCNIILGGNPWTHPGGKPWNTLIGKPMENFWWKTTEKHWWTTKENRCWKTADKMMENLENH